jgi:hypothetical protein
MKPVVNGAEPSNEPRHEAGDRFTKRMTSFFQRTASLK